MKHFKLKWLFLLLPLAFFLSFTDPGSLYEPVLMLRSEMEKAVQLKPAREIKTPGKIWVQDQYIFVIEKYKGIHLIDNTTPTQPKKIGFIHIDGCTDVAVKGDIIFANNAVDLIGIKTSPNFQSVSVVSRNRSVLPELESPEGWSNSDFEKNRPENSVIVRWELYNK
ncbi:hypothetical protein R9C00_14240 [Flammeovirgaceae bacterium SG7u.111]|nr:hypothetical protein [Flammeovirgaceae bacterium SG7u.132]WPO38616.1 hypothetical protein R9C00_14240 [Flammeovirgaceae bacterium SG7u.111]